MMVSSATVKGNAAGSILDIAHKENEEAAPVALVERSDDVLALPGPANATAADPIASPVLSRRADLP